MTKSYQDAALSEVYGTTNIDSLTRHAVKIVQEGDPQMLKDKTFPVKVQTSACHPDYIYAGIALSPTVIMAFTNEIEEVRQDLLKLIEHHEHPGEFVGIDKMVVMWNKNELNEYLWPDTELTAPNLAANLALMKVRGGVDVLYLYLRGKDDNQTRCW